MNLSIRRARHEDAQGIIDVHLRSIREICSKDYTPEQIAAWSGRNHRCEMWQQSIDRDYIWVVVLDHDIYGFGHFAVMDNESAEVLALYFIPPALGKGLAKKIFSEMLKISHSLKLKKINLHSTITAKSFYESLGFQQNAGDTTVDMRGVAIPCYPMEFIVP